MKSLFVLITLVLNINIFLSQENEPIQKTMLIKTNLTKEELYQILSSAENGKNNTSIEEVDTEIISDSETLIKNGKVKIKIKLEFDLNNEQKNKKAFIQTITPIKANEKISLINYLLAFGISIILISCFYLSFKMKRNSKLILIKKNAKINYILKDD